MGDSDSEFANFVKERIDNVKKNRLLTNSNGENIFDDKIGTMIDAYEALLKEDTDPQYKYDASREEGNYSFKHGKYDDAIAAYTNGLSSGITNKDDLAVLLNNRSLCHMKKNNFGYALVDALKCLEYNPMYLSSLNRAIKLTFRLLHFEDCNKLFQQYHRIVSKDKVTADMIELYDKYTKAQNKLTEIMNLRGVVKKMRNMLQMDLISEISQRGIKMLPTVDMELYTQEDEEYNIPVDETNLKKYDKLLRENDGSVSLLPDYWILKEGSALSSFVYFDYNSSELYWPIVVLYPEYKTADIIKQVNENENLLTHIKKIITQGLNWDTEKIYVDDKICTYFEDKRTQRLVSFNPDVSLITLLGNEKFYVLGGTPTIMIYSKLSKIYKQIDNNCDKIVL